MEWESGAWLAKCTWCFLLAAYPFDLQCEWFFDNLKHSLQVSRVAARGKAWFASLCARSFRKRPLAQAVGNANYVWQAIASHMFRAGCFISTQKWHLPLSNHSDRPKRRKKLQGWASQLARMFMQCAIHLRVRRKLNMRRSKKTPYVVQCVAFCLQRFVGCEAAVPFRVLNWIEIGSEERRRRTTYHRCFGKGFCDVRFREREEGKERGAEGNNQRGGQDY